MKGLWDSRQLHTRKELQSAHRVKVMAVRQR